MNKRLLMYRLFFAIEDFSENDAEMVDGCGLFNGHVEIGSISQIPFYYLFEDIIDEDEHLRSEHLKFYAIGRLLDENR